MTDAVPAELTAVIDRITAPAAHDDLSPPSDVTGVLAGLWSWWAMVGSARPVVHEIESAPRGATTAEAAILAGVGAVDLAVDAGATLIVPRMLTRGDSTARTVIALLTRREASAVVHQPDGMTDRDWMITCAEVRDRAAAAVDLRGEPIALLDALGTPAIAMVAGMLLGAAARRTPCLLDGTDELAAALVADRLCYRAKGWWLAASDSPDPGRTAAIDRVDLAVAAPLRLTDDRGRGAHAVVALLDGLADD